MAVQHIMDEIKVAVPWQIGTVFLRWTVCFIFVFLQQLCVCACVFVCVCLCVFVYVFQFYTMCMRRCIFCMFVSMCFKHEEKARFAYQTCIFCSVFDDPNVFGILFEQATFFWSTIVKWCIRATPLCHHVKSTPSSFSKKTKNKENVLERFNREWLDLKMNDVSFVLFSSKLANQHAFYSFIISTFNLFFFSSTLASNTVRARLFEIFSKPTLLMGYTWHQQELSENCFLKIPQNSQLARVLELKIQLRQFQQANLGKFQESQLKILENSDLWIVGVYIHSWGAR